MIKRLKNFIVETEIISCDLCGSDQFITFYKKMRHSLNLNTVVCNDCGLMYTNPRPTFGNLKLFYTGFYHYFHGRKGIDNHYLIKSKRFAQKRSDVILKIKDSFEKLEVLEIGCGVGEFLLNLSKKTNWNVSGIEAGKDSFKYCKELGINVEYKFFEDFLTNKKFDLITSFHVLEHLSSPKLFFLKVNSILKSGGLMYLEVPNLARPGGRLEIFFQYPHLYNFTFESIYNYGSGSGFTPIFLNNSVFNLTVIFRKTESVTGFQKKDIIKFDINQFVKRLNRLDWIYGYLNLLPGIKMLTKIKDGLTSYLST